ncbi:MAG: B12-binding domain-containing radical SAM protein [Armatimonadetes bacterium]|nr:B12-binding domain-containing radical SAM protein [Armatimonadota bacterium]
MSKIRKVTLIEPKPAGYHVYSRIALPRLGLPLLGAMLRKRSIDVSIYCQDFQEIDYSDVLSSDLVGISTTTSTAPEGYRIADRIREAGIPVVMGGSHVTFLPDEALQHADFCVRGEGEHTLMELVDAIEFGSGFGGVAGLSYRVGDEIRHNPPRELVRNLDSLPFPDLSLIRGREKVKLTPIATSRGCPHNCNFCSVIKMFGRGCRQRSVDNVLEELRYLNPATVFFYDDNFAGNKERAKILLDRMLSEGLTPYWTAQVRADVAHDKELLALMKRSNCYILYIGFESVNPATLREFNKRQSVDEIAEAVRIIHEHGIMIHGMFVFGAEHDDIASLRAATNFALKSGIDTVQFMMLTPLPGTQYFYDMEREGRLLTREWNLYDGQHVVYQPKLMSPYELQKETFKAMKRFYSVYECVKMLAGPEFIKFAIKLNVNLMLGRWRSARQQLRSAVRRWFYRAYGHILIKRWEAANKDFGERIKALAEKARSIGAPRQPSPGKVE